MTTYVFETMTADDAANFTAEDTLVFSNASLFPSDVSVANSNNNLNGTTLTAGGKSLLFPGNTLSAASQQGNINFTSAFIGGEDFSLYLGTSGNDLVIVFNENEDDGNAAYGFFGQDTVIGSSGADVIFGGGGSDVLLGGDGNDHLYGFQFTGTASLDGTDFIDGGNGNDYIQGNAGNDLLSGGGGSDRINGGADNDIIIGDYLGGFGGGDDSLSAASGNDTINGNKGDDIILGGDGNDSLRGGQGDDFIFGGNDNDIILGDLGNDTLIGGSGIDIMTGGEGEDFFVIAGDGVGEEELVTEGTFAYFSDVITDFEDGKDMLGFLVEGDDEGDDEFSFDVIHAQEGITIESIAAALTYAQQLLDANDSEGAEIVALDVGSDAYLFYAFGSESDAINGMIKLAGVSAANITADDFGFRALPSDEVSFPIGGGI